MTADNNHFVKHPAKLAAQARYWRAKGQDDLADVLEAELVALGRCRRCGRGLTDPTSLKAGLGPDCREKP
jgi:hypothetical protein